MMECEACGRWSCVECQDMTLDMYNVFDIESTHAPWFCRACEKVAIQAMKAAVRRDDRDINSISDKVSHEVEKVMTEQVWKDALYRNFRKPSRA